MKPFQKQTPTGSEKPFQHVHTLFHKHKFTGLALTIAASFLYVVFAFAAVATTPATYTGTITADQVGGAWTSLTGPIIAEGSVGDIGKFDLGTVILNVPSGFQFDTGGTAPTVLVTCIGGSCGPSSRNINGAASGTSLAVTSITSTQVTFTVTSKSNTGAKNSLTWQNLRVRPTSGTPLASGNIYESGAATVNGITQGSSGTNFGTLGESVGAASQLAFTTQPSSTATVNTDFATKPAVSVEDQYGNVLTTDTRTISIAARTSSSTCSTGSAGSGTITSTPTASGAPAVNGVLTYTAMQYSAGESIKLCATASVGSLNALSNTVTVTGTAAVVTNVTSTTPNGSYKAGTVIPITVTFDQTVTVTGTPKLTLATAGITNEAVNYSSGSGTNTLTFNYTVSAGDTSSHLDYLNTTALALNGGTIKNGGQNAVLTLATPGVSGSLSANKNIVIDTTAPTLPSVSIASNNPTTTLAKVGDTVTVSFTSSETIQTPTVTIDGTSATVSGSGTSWTASRTMTSGDASGTVTFAINYSDIAGNNGIQVTSTTNSSSVTFDKTIPTLTTVTIASNNANTSLAKVGNTVTVSFTASESLQTPTVTIGGTSATVSGGPTSWTASRTMTSGDTEGVVAFAINYSDLAGNSGTQVTTTTNSSSVTFDKTAPTLTTVTIASNNSNTSAAKVGDTVTLSFTASESLQTPTVTIDGVAATVSGGPTIWTATRTMTSGDTEGALAFAINFSDLAGNNGTQVTTTTNSSSVTFYKTPPTLSTVSIASNNANSSLAKVGDTVTVSFASTQTLQTPTVTIGGSPATVSGGPISWTASRTMTSGDTEGVVAFTINYTDVAGNSGTQVTATTNSSSVTFDKTAPVLAEVTPVPTPKNNPAPHYTFSSTKAGAITYGGDCSSSTTSAVSGNNTITFNTLADGTHNNCTIKVTDAAGNASSTLAVSSFIIDTVPPTLTTVSIASNNSNTSAAKVGDTVTLSFTASESLQTPTVTIDGVSATVLGGPTVWTATYTLTSGDTAGSLPFTINFADLAGNNGTPVTSTTNSSGVVFQKTPPTLSSVSIASNNSDTSKAKVGDTVTVSFISSESVQTPTVTIVGTVATVSGGPTAWTASRVMTSGDTEGTVAFTIQFSDLAGNSGTQVTSTTDSSSVTFDKTGPVLAEVTPVPTPSNNTTPNYTFSSTKTGTITYGGDCSSSTTTAVSGNNAITFNTLAQGTHNNCTIQVTDSIGNVSNTLTVTSFSIDLTVPTVVLSSTTTSLTNITPIPVTATFSKNVTGFDQTHITVGGGSITSFSAVSGSVYNFDVTPTAPGTVTVDIAAGVAQDAAGNNNTAATELSRTFDNVPPVLAEVTAVPTPSNNKTPTYTFSSTKAGSIVYGGACSSSTSTAVTGNNTVTFNSLSDDTYSNCTIKVTDAAGNISNILDVSSFIVDTTAPTVSLSSTTSSITNVTPIPVTATFSEDVTGFDQTHITVGDGSVTSFSAVSGSVYNFSVTPSAPGTVTVDIAAGVVQDAAGNNNTAATQLSRSFDNVAPTVTLTSLSPDPTDSSPISVTATFSKDVTGFALNNVTVGNGTAGNFVAVSGSVYTFDVTPSSNGSVTVDIGAGIVQDAAGNNNTAASQFAITFNSTKPTVALTSSVGSITNVSPIPMTATFSEDVTGFDQTHIVTGNGSVSNFVPVSASVYTFDVTPAGQGTVTVDIPADVAQDSATNTNFAAVQFSTVYDTVAPVITSAQMQDTNHDGIVDRIVLYFSKPLAAQPSGSNGFDVSSTSDHGLCNSVLSQPDGTATLDVDFVCSKIYTAIGDLTLNLLSNPKIADSAGNQVANTLIDESTASPEITDDAAPIVASTTPSNGTVGVAVNTPVVVNFSEPMDTGTVTISDDNSNSYSSAIWSNNNSTLTSSHTDWTPNVTVHVTVQGKDLAGLSVYNPTSTWSFSTGTNDHLGRITVPQNIVTDDSGTDVSNGVNTSSGGSILIDDISTPLDSVTHGDLVNADLTALQFVGDQSVLPVKDVVLKSTGDITLQNSGINNASVDIPNNTDVWGCAGWDGTLTIKAGTNSGNPPSGFSIGTNVFDIGSSSCPLLLDKPVTILLTGLTGPVAYKPTGSVNWFAIPTCSGTYASPTPPSAPVPFQECSATDGTNTKIVTYHFTSFGPLVAGSSPTPPPPPAPTSSRANGGSGPALLLLNTNGSLKGGSGAPGTSKLHGTSTSTTASAPPCSRDINTIPFNDIGSDPNRLYIEDLYQKCAVDGKTSTQFAANDSISKAELSKALVIYNNLGTANYVNIFNDVKQQDWFAPYMLKAVQLGIINMQSVNSQKQVLLSPDDIVTRAEALSMIFKASNIDVSHYSKQPNFVDVSQQDWFHNVAAYAQNANLLSGFVTKFDKSGKVSDYYQFTNLLGLSDKGQEVTDLKSVMMQLEYYSGEINDTYDVPLENAVAAYQKAHHLDPSGQMGPLTRAKILSEYLVPKTILAFKPYDPISRSDAAKVIYFAHQQAGEVLGVSTTRYQQDLQMLLQFVLSAVVHVVLLQ